MTMIGTTGTPGQKLPVSWRAASTRSGRSGEIGPGDGCRRSFTINFHDWLGNGWAVLFSHPKDFTPVCTTELGYMAKLEPEFKKRNCKVIGLSVDPVEKHTEWEKDIRETQGYGVNYPM